MTSDDRPPGSLSVRDLLAVDGVRLVLVDPDSDDGKSPLTCFRHGPCRMLTQRYHNVCPDEWTLRHVLAAHPHVLLGVSPGRSLLILDVDALAGLVLLLAAGLKPSRTFTVKSPKGWHVYLSVDPAEMVNREVVGTLPHVDVRWDGWETGQYVLAPGSVRSDGGEYVIESGTWGRWASLSPKLRALSTRPSSLPVAVSKSKSTSQSKPKPELRPGERELTVDVPLTDWERAGLDGMLAEFLTRCEQTWQRYEDVPLAEQTDKTESEWLAAAWFLARHVGLTPVQAVDAVLAYRPTLGAKAVRRGRRWALSDATRVYGKTSGKTRERQQESTVVYTPGDLRDDLVLTTRRTSSVVPTYDWLVARCNALQKDTIGVGVLETAEHFGVSKVAASKALNRLVELGAITRVSEHVWTSGMPGNRVREFQVNGLTASRRDSAPSPSPSNPGE